MAMIAVSASASPVAARFANLPNKYLPLARSTPETLFQLIASF